MKLFTMPSYAYTKSFKKTIAVITNITKKTDSNTSY